MIPSIIQMATTTVSLITFCILGVTGTVTGVSDYNGVVVFESDMIGVSIGGFIMGPPEKLAHEYGHTLQARELGVMYLPVIGIPSMINTALALSGAISVDDYRNSYTETWANDLGGHSW